MFNETGIVRVRNVNGALARLRHSLRDPRRDYFWRTVSPRGIETVEYRGPMVTEYWNPTERVLWSPLRDANPFFHLMESLWILAGRSDVAFLSEFNRRMAEYSDDGKTFHAPYGHRLRHWPVCGGGGELDQLRAAILKLELDHDTRQVVLGLWDPARDLVDKHRDIPCNDLVMLKIRDGALNMTVCCRSNDAVWGAYGANVVQFSMLQEFIAGAVGVEVGTYRQISDSFHVYTDNDVWKAVVNGPEPRLDHYDAGIAPFALFSGYAGTSLSWLDACEAFCNESPSVNIPFFVRVATPMRLAWRMYREACPAGGAVSYGQRCIAVAQAQQFLMTNMADCDWRLAAIQWLGRRGGAK